MDSEDEDVEDDINDDESNLNYQAQARTMVLSFPE